MTGCVSCRRERTPVFFGIWRQRSLTKRWYLTTSEWDWVVETGDVSHRQLARVELRKVSSHRWHFSVKLFWFKTTWCDKSILSIKLPVFHFAENYLKIHRFSLGLLMRKDKHTCTRKLFIKVWLYFIIFKLRFRKLNFLHRPSTLKALGGSKGVTLFLMGFLREKCSWCWNSSGNYITATFIWNSVITWELRKLTEAKNTDHYFSGINMKISCKNMNISF